MRTLLRVSPLRDVGDPLRAGADAVVFDVNDPDDSAWIATVRGELAAKGDDTRPLAFVRIDGMDMRDLDAVLAAFMPCEPDGIVLGRCANGSDVQHLGAKLAVHEAKLDLADGQTSILAEIGAFPRSFLVLDSFVACSPRLLALVWNPRAFAAGLGVDPDGGETGPATTARHLTVMAARAAEVGAFDWAAGHAATTIEAIAEQARRDGFNAVVTDTACDLSAITAAFDNDASPSA